MDLITVVVPVYNVEKYLERNLNSLVNQTYKNVEILVINDGTLDNSQDIIDRFVKKYPRTVKSFIKKNGGISDTRNFGIDQAKGKFIAFIDSDDYVEIDFLEKLYNSIISTESDIAVSNIIDEYENTGKSSVYKNYVPEVLCSLKEDKKQLFNRMSVWNKLFKKELFDDMSLRFSKGKIYEDTRLVPKLFVKAKKISYVDDALYHYIIRSGSLMTSSDLQKNLDIMDAFDDIIDFFKKEKLYHQFKAEIEYLAIEHIVVATLLRVVKASEKKDIEKNVKIYIDYMNNNFADYNQNPYLIRLSKYRKVALKLIQKRHFKILRLMRDVRG